MVMDVTNRPGKQQEVQDNIQVLLFTGYNHPFTWRGMSSLITWRRTSIFVRLNNKRESPRLLLRVIYVTSSWTSTLPRP
ncbi:hypothetical protein CEXT_716311 [Caerostris extrusa]|uniref:Uncharacterized protein n=1 Tax=Caerostris extrusa TaxID=172846 RepID=A0AAV4W0G0_CAEEX|nr:hypothetical protein CEXT_716311 [Caerostris extrusa]